MLSSGPRFATFLIDFMIDMTEIMAKDCYVFVNYIVYVFFLV